MANLGNLIVRGVTRILGDAYANKFIGNLQGNADTATSAIKASTADSATSAISANKASIATAVQDYGTSSYKEIKIGYSGSGLSSSNIETAVGFTDGGTKIKDISKDEFRNWLATASGTWNISISGNAATATNADKLDGYHKNDILRRTVAQTSVISLNNVVTEGIDFTSWAYAHSVNVNNQPWGDGASSAASVVSFGTDYPFQIYSDYSNTSYLYYRSYYAGNGWKAWRQFAFLDSSVASSSKWETPRTITLTGSVTGSVSIDGSQNVSLATTTNHTHTFDSLTSKPTTISGYGITDALTSKYITYKHDFQQYVILLCRIGTNTTNDQHTINGTFWTTAYGVTRYQAAYINVYCSDWTSNHNEYYGFTPFGLGTKCRLVTCTYQSSQYLAITFESVQAISIYFDGSYSNILFTPILYYTLSTSTVENSEIYNSITEVTYNKIPLISSAETALTSSNFNSYAPKLDGTGASGTWGINISGNAVTASNASAVNGVSFTWDGEITSSQWIAAWESGTSIRTMSAYNTFISMCSYLDEDASDVTDGTMFITSYAIDNGFADPNNKNKPYKRKASFLWNYINNKCSSIYATQSWVNSNYYTCSESDSRYIQSETDPVWNAAKGNYYTKTECNNKFQPKGTYLTEQNLQGYATQEWVRGEEYLYRSGGTMDARAEIGITTKLFIGNSTSSDTCYTKFNCILHGGGDESNPNWIIRDNGYAEFKSSVSANAFYASSDIRLKNILDDINIDFDKLKLIPKKYYTWKGSDILQLGTIAQDIQKIYPEVVSKNENGYLSVDYSKLSIIALAAIDKLNERIKELECQIKL